MDIPKRRGGPKKPSTIPVDRTFEPTEGIKIKKVRFFAKIWVKLNGQKRNIGIALQGIGYLATLATPAGWGLVAIGGLISGVGVVHDLKKKHEENKENGNDDIWSKLLQFLIEILTSLKKKE